MKVKVFKTTNKAFRSPERNILQFEQDINHWIENNPKINITNIKQSTFGGILEVQKLFISVWYEED